MADVSETSVWNYEVIKEGEDRILKINCEDYPKLPSLEDDDYTMSKTFDILVETRMVSRVVYSQRREYEYDFSQTQFMVELANFYATIIRKGLLAYQNIGGTYYGGYYAEKYGQVQSLLNNTFKRDPLGAYVELKRVLREEQINLDKTLDTVLKQGMQRFVQLLIYLIRELEKTRIITIAGPYLAGHKIGDRSIYRRIFIPTIKPDFMFTKLMATYPTDGEELDNYSIGDTEVTIFSLPNTVQYLYHVIPPEFRLDEEKYELLDMARKILSEHKPTKSEFVDPKSVRQVFYNIGKDLIEELADYKKIRLRGKELEQLTEILVRYTIGFGLIEVLLQDEKIQDISINSPMGQTPMFIVHQDYDDCMTNIIPISADAESWASKLRLISGRPLDEADPILDTELELPTANARVAVITQPHDPSGLAFSFRRHRDKPWTLPLFIKAKMITPEAAGLLSFLIDGTRTMLIAGTRSSGKSSLLSGLLVEIMRRYRIITIEDTLELPTNQLRKLGYNIQSMKVASALTKEGSEVSAEDGIRSTLRLGDSALIVGEVRSKEAISLYEAMRVGAAANVVAGTIHGDSPYGVYDRVVNDIGVPKTSFKATDIIVTVNPIKSPDGIHRMRRVLQITEVRKKWENDPMLEGAFVDLMKYDVKQDALLPTSELLNGDSEILKAIAGNIKEFAGNWDAVWDNIVLRGKIKDALVKASDKANKPDMLEAPFVIKSNDAFHKISEKVKEELGELDSKRIYQEWVSWLNREIKKNKFSEEYEFQQSL